MSMSRPMLLAVLMVLLIGAPTAARALEPVERDGRVYCGPSFVNGLNLPPDDHPDPSHALRIMLKNVDRGYLSSLASARPARRVDPQQQCRRKAYRLRARQYAHVRSEARAAYDDAVTRLERAEAIASDHCAEQEGDSRAWAKCERAAAKERSALRSAVFKARRDWESVADPPDFGSEARSQSWADAATARRLLAAALAEERAVSPRAIGSEIWCGNALVRAAGLISDPIFELERVLQIQGNGPRAVSRSAEDVEREANKLQAELERSSRGLGRRDLAERLAKLRTLRDRLQGEQCKADWASARLVELRHVPAAVEARYLEAKAEFDALDQACDRLEPEGQGWIKADPKTEEWISCRNRVRRERNQKLRAMKSKKGSHDRVQEMLAKHERRAKP